MNMIFYKQNQSIRRGLSPSAPIIAKSNVWRFADDNKVESEGFMVYNLSTRLPHWPNIPPCSCSFTTCVIFSASFPLDLSQCDSTPSRFLILKSIKCQQHSHTSSRSEGKVLSMCWILMRINGAIPRRLFVFSLSTPIQVSLVKLVSGSSVSYNLFLGKWAG